ncbi:MAG: hypothetical protein ACXAEN_25980, partial [Candidatus Thorarchaeota archaeon]
MTKAAPWNNNFYMKWCDTTGCWDSGYWNWVDTDELNIGEIDDAISMATYQDELYVGTFDPAIILKYYNSNQTVWHCLNEQYAQAIYNTYPDGVPDFTASQGFYALTVRDGVLHAFSYAWGLNWSLAGDGLNWAFNNATNNGTTSLTPQFSRSILFNSEIYYGNNNDSGFQRIGAFNNITFNPVFQDTYTDFFLYFEEFNSELYATNQNNLYVRRESAPRITIKSPSNNQVIYGDWRLVAKVETDKDVLNVKFVLAEYDVSYDAMWDSKLGIYYYEHMDTKQFSNGVYHLRARLNHSDGSYSTDNISFEINHDLHNDYTILDDGTLRYTYQAPWVPPIDWINGPDYVEGVEYLDPYTIWTYEVTEVSSSPAASHTSWNPYDITENDVEILSDKLWLSEVPDDLNIWINDTKSTSGTGDDINLVNDAGVTHYSLSGQNITIECDTTAISYMRESKVKLVNSFLWASHPDGSWGVSLTWYDNGTTDYTNNVFFIGAGEKNNVVVPIDVAKATVFDQTNGMALHNGKEFTVTGGGFWMAISTMSSGDSRTFTFRYFEHKETIATQLVLSPYMCDTSGSPYNDKPIRCIVNHDQPGDEDFSGTVIIELSEVSRFGKINWNRVLMRTQTDNQVYSKGTDWYVSGDYQITMPNMDIESGESITWEIFIGTVERSPGAAFDSFGDWGWFPAIFILFYSAYRFMKGLEKPDKS